MDSKGPRLSLKRFVSVTAEETVLICPLCNVSIVQKSAKKDCDLHEAVSRFQAGHPFKDLVQRALDKMDFEVFEKTQVSVFYSILFFSFSFFLVGLVSGGFVCCCLHP
jgi:hypothetical protein